MARFRARPKHVYIHLPTGLISNPGRGNVNWCNNPDYKSIGHYFTYFSISSIYDNNSQSWIVTRRNTEIGRFPYIIKLNREEYE